MGNYRDNNNYLLHNKVETNDNRFSSLLNPYEFTFLSLDVMPSWIGDASKKVYNMSSDGITYAEEECEIYYGTYFFLSDNKVEHQRTLQTIVNVMSEYGGFSSLIFSIFGAVGEFVNDQLFMGLIISTLYAAKICEPESDDSSEEDQDESFAGASNNVNVLKVDPPQNPTISSTNGPEEQKEVQDVDLEGGGRIKRAFTFKKTKTFVNRQKAQREKDYGKEMVFSYSDKFSHLKYDIMQLLTLCKTIKGSEMENKKRLLKESEILYHEGYEAVV